MSQSQLAPNDAESEKKTLRDRVTRLETLMAALLTDKPSQRASEGGAATHSDQESDLSDFSDDEEFAEQRGLKAPLISLLGPDEVGLLHGQHIWWLMVAEIYVQAILLTKSRDQK